MFVLFGLHGPNWNTRSEVPTSLTILNKTGQHVPERVTGLVAPNLELWWKGPGLWPRENVPDKNFMQKKKPFSQKNSRRLWRSRRRKSSSVPAGAANFPAAVFLAGKCPNLGRDSISRCRKIGESFSSSVEICPKTFPARNFGQPQPSRVFWEKNLMQKKAFSVVLDRECCFRPRLAGMSRDLGRDTSRDQKRVLKWGVRKTLSPPTGNCLHLFESKCSKSRDLVRLRFAIRIANRKSLAIWRGPRCDSAAIWKGAQITNRAIWKCDLNLFLQRFVGFFCDLGSAIWNH